MNDELRMKLLREFLKIYIVLVNMLIRYGDNLNIIIFWRCILTNSIIADKSFDFAIDIVDLYKKLSTNNKNYVLLNQNYGHLWRLN